MATTTTMSATPAPNQSSSSSASGLLSMLTEPSPPLIEAALGRLLKIVDTQWHEVAQSLPDLEAMAEDMNQEYTPTIRSTAAALASRVFFHLEEEKQALRLALESELDLFHVGEVGGKGEKDGRDRAYADCLIGAAMDAYVQDKRKSHPENNVASKSSTSEPEEETTELNLKKLYSVVQNLFAKCYLERNYQPALGIALEAMETPKIEEILNQCSQRSPPLTLLQLLDYTLTSVMNVNSLLKSFRDEVVRVLAMHLQLIVDDQTIDKALRKASAVSLSRAHQVLRNAKEVAKIMSTLLDGKEEDEGLLGMQLCFDLMECGDQSFVEHVASFLPKKGEAVEGEMGEEEENEVVERSEEIWGRYESAQRVLTGGFSCELGLSFLHKNSHSDKMIMENLKKALEERSAGRSSVLHNCAVMTHSYLNAGTTDDSFLRDNLEWMKKASNWAKFSATASLGVIHAGHITEAMPLLEPYLPPSPNTEDPSATEVSATGGYAEGGSLYALGLIHGSQAGSSASQREETNNFLLSHLRNSRPNEVISHGAALGIGLTALGTNDLNVVNELKELLETDSAVAGEGAGIAIGLVLAGSGAGNVNNSVADADAEEMSEIITYLKNYARETHHEKIIRGISMGLALVNYGQEENADAMIDDMRSDRDPILRYGAQYALALAYCGTGSNKAIRILLHTAVSDVSDDVRMAAVIGLAFVLYKTPDRVPQLVKLLLESFNPHVRYGSCIAVGLAMAGSGDSESIALLEPMLSDMTDFVRQGALLGTAMIYMQQGDSCNGKKIKSFREKLANTLKDKHQTTLTKMGAILATGIIDAGGRNCTFDFGSKNGFTKLTSAVGAALWLQHWYWFPMMHMLSLAVTPTYTIGLNKDFKFPKSFEIHCAAKPSAFAYPKPLEEKKKEEKKRVETVTLSTTAKNKARLARKKAKEEGESGGASEAMEESLSEEKSQEESEEKEAVREEAGESMEVDDTKEEEGGTEGSKIKKKREPEPTSFRLSNPCRITKAQAEACVFDLNQRYRPIHQEEKPCGVIIVTDSTPGEEEDLGTVKPPSIESEDEADAPEPFEWTPPNHPEAQGNATAATDETPTSAE